MLRGEQIVVAAGDAEGDLLVGLDEVGAGCELLRGGSVDASFALAEVKEEILQGDLGLDQRDLNEGVAAGCEGLGEWADDSLIGEDGDAFKDGEVGALLYAETVCGLLGSLPCDAGAGIVGLGEVDEFSEDVGVSWDL